MDIHDITPEILDRVSDPELWVDTDYELGFCLSIGSLDAGMRENFLRLIWTRTMILGPFPKSMVINQSHDQAPPFPHDVFDRYGVIQIQDQILGCKVSFLSNEYESWCLFAIPTPFLEIYNWPQARIGEVSWDQINIQPLNTAFMNIASSIYPDVPYQFAIIGEEASGVFISRERLQLASLPRTRSYTLIVPVQSFRQESIEPFGEELTSELRIIHPSL
jgi:hypothetical protein